MAHQEAKRFRAMGHLVMSRCLLPGGVPTRLVSAYGWTGGRPTGGRGRKRSSSHAISVNLITSWGRRTSS
eukprot:11592357-Alexandrium_andersonii.AAC.1